jgi:hypothetical protein
MKKSIVFVFAVMLAFSGFTQKNSSCVVMYFKADLACCKARACAALENDVKSVVEKNFTNGNVVFKEVKLSDPDNASLVEQYKAQSQTVIIVTNKKKKFTSVDATPLVKDFVKSQDKTGFETAFVKLISDSLK